MSSTYTTTHRDNSGLNPIDYLMTIKNAVKAMTYQPVRDGKHYETCLFVVENDYDLSTHSLTPLVGENRLLTVTIIKANGNRVLLTCGVVKMANDHQVHTGYPEMEHPNNDFSPEPWSM